MDEVFSVEQVSRMLKLPVEAVWRLQANHRLDQVDTSKIKGGVSASSVQAYRTGGVATMNREFKLGGR